MNILDKETVNILDIDKGLFFLINHGASNALFDAVMPFITAKGYLLLLPYLLYILYKAYVRQKTEDDKIFNVQVVLWSFLLAALAFLLGDWFGNEIKRLVGRVRPCNVLEGVKLLVGCTQSYSMPSNHAINSFAAAVTLFYFARNRVPVLLSIYPLIIAALVAFSRVYVGVHYPTDIIVGALLGTAIGFLVIGLYRYASSRYEVRPYTTLLFSVLLVISVFRIYYILHGPLDLSPDEAHYWEWSRRPDLSYYSKGPMIAYLIYIGTAIFGDTVFGIRIMAVIFSALSSIYMFKLVNLMYKDSYESKDGKDSELRTSSLMALSSALLLQVIPLFAPFGVIFTIDSPFIFFWILSLYFFWKAITSEHRIQNTEHRLTTLNSEPRTPNSKLQAWLFLGISIGLGLLTKYTMAFFYVSSFLFLIFSEKRFLLRGLRPYTALITSILIFSPVIIWNFQYDWVTIRHTAGQAHVSEGIKISLKTFFEFLGAQIGIITPILFVLIIYALFKMQKSDYSLRSKFLFWFSVPVIAFFLLKSLQGKVQPNWAMTGYITGIIAFAKYFLNRKWAHSQLLVLAGIGLALFVTVISHYPAILNLPPKTDPTSRLRGWEELGAEVSRIYDSIAEKGHVFIFSDRYQVSSELAFYAKGHPRTYCINLGRRMNQYDLWPDMNSDAEKIKKGSRVKGQGSKNYSLPQINAIFVRIDDTDMPSGVAMAFDSFEKGLLKVYDKGYLLREYSIFICYNFKGLKTVRPERY